VSEDPVEKDINETTRVDPVATLPQVPVIYGQLKHVNALTSRMLVSDLNPIYQKWSSTSATNAIVFLSGIRHVLANPSH
jgi:hypothetical protein